MSGWPTAALLLCCCWISQLPYGFIAVSADSDANGDVPRAPVPFFGAASAGPASDARSRLRVEMAAELLLMAVGRHTYFLDGLMRPPPPYQDEEVDYEATDQRQHTQAAVALHLLQQLRFMEAIDEKLTAAAQETSASVLDYRTAMQVFFEMLQRKLEQDGAALTAFMEAEPEVRAWYSRLPATRRRYAAVRVVAAPTLLRVVGRESAFVRRLTICTLFLETARRRSLDHHSKLAANVLRLARHKDAASHIERIFQAAVDETAADVEGLQDGQRILDSLFRKLVEKMRGDAQLNSQSTRAKIVDGGYGEEQAEAAPPLHH